MEGRCNMYKQAAVYCIMIQSSGHSIHYHKIPYQVHHVGCVASKWQMTWSVSIVTDDKRMQTQKRLDFSCNPIKLLLCHSKLGLGGFEKSAIMCMPLQVPEGTRYSVFKITTRTLLEKFYYSAEQRVVQKFQYPESGNVTLLQCKSFQAPKKSNSL